MMIMVGIINVKFIIVNDGYCCCCYCNYCYVVHQRAYMCVFLRFVMANLCGSVTGQQAKVKIKNNIENNAWVRSLINLRVRLFQL